MSETVSDSTRYVVVGAGAVGALLAAQLVGAGRDAVLVARGSALAAISDAGVRVARPERTDVYPVEAFASVADAGLREGDIVVLTVKSQDADALLAEIAWQPVLDADGSPTLLGADLPIVTLQNGLATEDAALRRFSEVYGATIAIAAAYLTPGEVSSPSFPVIGLFWVGAYPSGIGPRQGEIVGDFRAAGYETASVDDIRAFKAWKLLGNVANGLDVLSGTAEEKADARAALVAEANAAFAGAGITPAVVDRSAGFAQLTNRPVPGYEGARLSTWQSFTRGSSSEVDHLNGEVVLLGRRHGVRAPVNERLQRLLGAQSARGAAVGTHAVAELLAAAAAAAPAGPAGPAGPAEPAQLEPTP